MLFRPKAGIARPKLKIWDARPEALWGLARSAKRTEGVNRNEQRARPVPSATIEVAGRKALRLAWAAAAKKVGWEAARLRRAAPPGASRRRAGNARRICSTQSATPYPTATARRISLTRSAAPNSGDSKRRQKPPPVSGADQDAHRTKPAAKANPILTQNTRIVRPRAQNRQSGVFAEVCVPPLSAYSFQKE